MDKKRNILLFFFVLFFGLAIRLIIAWLALSPLDTDSFYHMFIEMKKGNGMYSVNWLYFNNPPVWGWFVWILGNLAEKTGLWFSFLLKIPLILSDTLLSLIIFYYSLQRLNWFASLFYFSLIFLNPLLIVVSAYQGQMESLFLLFLMISFLILDKPHLTYRRVTFSAIFFGLSCTIKIIPLIVLPVFLLYLLREKEFLVKKIIMICLFILLSSLIFILVFLPYLDNINYIFFRIFAYRPPFWGFWGILSVNALLEYFVEFSTRFEAMFFANQLIVLWVGISLYLFLILLRNNNLLWSLLVSFFSIYVTATFFSYHYLVWVIPFLIIYFINTQRPQIIALLIYSFLATLLEISWLLAVLADEKNTFKRWKIITLSQEIVIPPSIVSLGNLINMPFFLFSNLLVWSFCVYFLFYFVRKTNLPHRH